MSIVSIAGYIDHTLLKPNATIEQIEKLCQEAIEYHFRDVCVNPCHVSLCREILHGYATDVSVVIGFPLGANCELIKVTEANNAILDGADELDMVMNIGHFLSGHLDLVSNEITDIVDLAHAKDVLVKVIIETGLLSDKELPLACEVVVAAGADFVKTCTGFSGGQATVEDIKLIKAYVGDKAKIKASGGVKTYIDALKMIEAGASRIGTSAGVQIAEEEKAAL